jgi:hypothetical protein
MEQNNNQPTPQPAPQAPEISESEMKMPEDQFGDKQVSEPAPSHSVNPLFIVALILLLTILAVVVIWGEELVGMFMPDTTVELEPLPEGVENNETDLTEMENELNEIDLSTMEAELDMMEAEMDAELEAESEAQI